MPYELLPAQDDKLLFFHLEGEAAERHGSVGYLRADFGSNGHGFWTTWFDQQPHLKTLAFKNEFDEVINSLRNDRQKPPFASRDNLAAFCAAAPGKELTTRGCGAGKTRFYAKPNVMNCNTSMVILDPKGEIARDTGHLLINSGVEVRVLDLINMWRSHCYNPFVYLKEDNDVQRLVTNLFKSTTPKGAQTQDPFWDTAASMLLLALIFYLKYEAPPDEQNFPMVMEMLRSADVREEDEQYQSSLDELFDRLEMRDPEHIALKYYHNYRSGSGKTLKSIQITLAARLEKFNLESLAALTVTDELDLASIGEKRPRCSSSLRTTTAASISSHPFSIRSYFSSFFTASTTGMAVRCRYTSIF